LNAYPAFKGPLSGRHDDCYVTDSGDGAVFWDLPFFTANAHHGKEWSVAVALDDCPDLDCDQPPVTVPVRVGTGRWHRPGEDSFLHKPLNEKAVDAKVPVDTQTWVATFDADGVCTVKTGPTAGAECGVGRKA
jgi:hypothetical protein